MKKCKPAADYRAARRNEWRKGDLSWWAAFANHGRAARYIHHPPVRRNRAKRWDDADREMMLALNPGS